MARNFFFPSISTTPHLLHDGTNTRLVDVFWGQNVSTAWNGNNNNTNRITVIVNYGAIRHTHTQSCTLNSAKIERVWRQQLRQQQQKRQKKKQNTSTSPLRTRTLCALSIKYTNKTPWTHVSTCTDTHTHTRTAAPNHQSCFQVQHLIRLDGEEWKIKSLVLFWFTFNSTLLQVDESSCSSSFFFNT